MQFYSPVILQCCLLMLCLVSGRLWAQTELALSATPALADGYPLGAKPAQTDANALGATPAPVYSYAFRNHRIKAPTHTAIFGSAAQHPQIEPQVSSAEPWLAILGDSSVTGAASAPVYAADWWTLLYQAFNFIFESRRTELEADINQYPDPTLFNITAPILPATRLLYSPAEKREAEATNQFRHLNFEARLSRRLDTPEYAFGYMVGRALNFEPRQIVNAGQDGRQVTALGRQFKRLIESGAPTLPPLALVSFVANDFCHPDNFSRPVSEFRRRFETDVRAQLAELENLKPAPGGSRIVILAPLDVAEILTNPELLAQRIPFEGTTRLTCGELRQGLGPDHGLLARLMEKTLMGECKGVLQPVVDPAARLQRIVELQTNQVEAWRSAIRDFNRSAGPGIRVQFAESVRKIHFENGDLAGDCFHPGVRGHSRIARQLLTHELRNQRPNERAPDEPITIRAASAD